MRALFPTALVALTLAACSGPCKELADRLCNCPPAGVTKDTCKQQADSQLGDKSPTQSQCNAWLDSCQAPAGADFCEWTLTRCGKASCGMSDETVPTACETTPTTP